MISRSSVKRTISPNLTASLNVLDSALDEKQGRVAITADCPENDRTIYLPDAAIEVVLSYLERRVEGINPEEDKFLFTTVNGTRVDYELVWRTVKASAARAGIRKRVPPHLCRHTKLTQLGRLGMNEFEIRAFSGHKTLDQLSMRINMHGKLDLSALG